MSASVPSTVVARQFFELAKEEKKQLTSLKLIKFTYLAHGWSFVYLDHPLVDEDVEAWRYGPVFPELYHVLKIFGRDKVKRVPMSLRERFIDYPDLEDRERILIKSTYETYKNISGSQLIVLTHREGTPWSNTQKGKIIDSRLISEYYKKKEAENG